MASAKSVMSRSTPPGGEGGGDRLGAEQFGDMEVVSIRAAALRHRDRVLGRQGLVAQRDETALGPFVEHAVLEEVAVAALYALDLAALREVPQLVLRHVQMRRRALLIHQAIIVHAVYSTIFAGLRSVEEIC